MGIVQSLYDRIECDEYKLMLLEGIFFEVAEQTNDPSLIILETQAARLFNAKPSESDFQNSNIFKFLLDFCNEIDRHVDDTLPPIHFISAKESQDLNSIYQHLDLTNKEFTSILTNKHKDIDSRLKALESKITKTPKLYDKYLELNKAFFEKSKKFTMTFSDSVLRLRFLLEIEKDLYRLESYFLSSDQDNYIQTLLREVEQAFRTLTKTSSNTLKLMESSMGTTQKDLGNNRDPPVGFIEFDMTTYLSASDSILLSLKSLSRLESMKEAVILTSSVSTQLTALDKALSDYFLNSEKFKENALTKFHRYSKRSEGVNLFVHESFNLLDVQTQSTTAVLDALLKRTNYFLTISSDQDQLIVELFKKLNLIEMALDEIDIKLEESMLFDIKDLEKVIPASDLENKQELDTFKEILEKFKNNAPADMLEHMNDILQIFEDSSKIEEIRIKIRDSQMREIAKMKSDYQLTLNMLNSSNSSLEQEKKSLEESSSIMKINLEKSTQLTEKFNQILFDKDIEISNLKNNIASLAEEFAQMRESNAQLQDENSDLSRDLRLSKKTIRDKENELNEIKASLDSNT